MKWLIVGLVLLVFGLAGWIIGVGAQAGERKPERRPGVACMFDPACNTPERMRRERAEEQERRMRDLEAQLEGLQEREARERLERGSPRY